MASGTILSVSDDGFFHTAVVRVTEADESIADYTVTLASAILALLNDTQRREFLRLTVKAQRDRRIATTPVNTPVPISGDVTL